MPKGSPELTAARKEEIMNACEQLYQTMNFKEITLKKIGEVTSFTRTSIYNYFQTKEEIFLGLFQREYALWCEALEEILNGNETLTRERLADRIAETLSDRELMLKLLAVNLYDMEENSRMERLVEFKKAYGRSVELMEQILARFCPEWDEGTRHSVVISSLQFFPRTLCLCPSYGKTGKSHGTGRDPAGTDESKGTGAGRPSQTACIRTYISI
ncbi:MAG: TetR/AcrR family transcriptional regulator [Oscillospiraceae bacterium]|nr:TetR/AcrR family transcriptional regulator [Oscillospiraceae bacterium]